MNEIEELQELSKDQLIDLIIKKDEIIEEALECVSCTPNYRYLTSFIHKIMTGGNKDDC